jgi:uncharacterized membrane protein
MVVGFAAGLVVAVFSVFGIFPSAIPFVVAIASTGAAMLIVAAVLLVWRMASHANFGASEEMLELVRGGGR